MDPTPTLPEGIAQDGTRILIGGGPRTGKTYLARRLGMTTGHRVMRTEAILARGATFAQLGGWVSEWMAQPGPCIIEGLAVPRGIRHWLRNHTEPVPFDKVYWLGTNPRITLTKGQESTAKACATVWAQCVAALQQQGIIIEELIYQGDPAPPKEPSDEHEGRTDEARGIGPRPK